MSFEESSILRKKAHALIPGGCHTYAKGDDQFPEQAPPFIVRGSGCHVWESGREFIEYGMGLRAVTLGHAFPSVIEAVKRELDKGSNFTRPSPIEVECAEQFLALVPGMEMVKFCKDGSLAVDGAVRLSRAYTGRDMIAICADHPFFSTNDWFIGTTEMNAGIPERTRRETVKFKYNDLASLQALFDQYPGQIACVIMEAARIEEPKCRIPRGCQDIGPRKRCAARLRRNDHRLPMAPERGTESLRRDAGPKRIRESAREWVLRIGPCRLQGDHEARREQPRPGASFSAFDDPRR